MWPFSKKIEVQTPKNPVDPRYKEVEEKYPLGRKYSYHEQEVVLVKHHSIPHIYRPQEPGVYIEWWTTTKELKNDFIGYPYLRYLTLIDDEE